MEIGYEEGAACGRDGCTGHIERHDVENCSCHISPPCSACTSPQNFCPECDWEEVDDPEPQPEVRPKTPEEVAKEKAYWAKWAEENKPRTLKDLDPTRIDWIYRPHSNSSMVKEGVYPAGTEYEVLLEAIRGTFGGAFAYHYPPENGSHGRFKYIAYTD